VSDSTLSTLAIVDELVREVLGDGFGADVTIGLETSFWKDLELESIELVTLGEQLQVRFGDKVDFVSWLSGKELDQIVNLRVGDLVGFIDGALAG
jgi:acyl carrier protein